MGHVITHDSAVHQVGAHFEAHSKGVLMAPLDPRYTQVGFDSISVQLHYRSFLRAPRKKYLSQKSHGYFDILVRYFSPCVLVLMMDE